MAKVMGIQVHSSKEGMAIVMNKHALVAIKEGRVGQVNLTSGQGTIVLQLMRDSTFKKLKAQEEKALKTAHEVTKALLDPKGEQHAEQ